MDDIVMPAAFIATLLLIALIFYPIEMWIGGVLYVIGWICNVFFKGLDAGAGLTPDIQQQPYKPPQTSANTQLSLLASGRVVQTLRPVGKVEIDGQTYECRAENSGTIDKGAAVVVVQIQPLTVRPN